MTAANRTPGSPRTPERHLLLWNVPQDIPLPNDPRVVLSTSQRSGLSRINILLPSFAREHWQTLEPWLSAAISSGIGGLIAQVTAYYDETLQLKLERDELLAISSLGCHLDFDLTSEVKGEVEADPVLHAQLVAGPWTWSSTKETGPDAFERLVSQISRQLATETRVAEIQLQLKATGGSGRPLINLEPELVSAWSARLSGLSVVCDARDTRR